jgi:hypothetical protein
VISILVGTILTVPVCCHVVFAQGRPNHNAIQRIGDIDTQLVALQPSRTPNWDIALANLLCAEGLPGAENLDVTKCLCGATEFLGHKIVE